MSSTQSLARPYARAAFELARESNALGEWSRKLELAAAIANDAKVRSLIGDPRVSGDALITLFLDTGDTATSTFGNFLSTLVANRRLPLLAEVAAGFAELKRESEGVLKVRVRAAVPIESAQADAIKAALAKRFGRTIDIESVIDESVIGGAVIDAGDVVIDGSVRGRLERLAQALTQ
jgi:F-type H+-transporting ATPase subunit delta